MTTTVNVVGTIATDPRLITSNSGVQLCTFRIASDERRYDREQQSWVEGSTNWFGIVCFRSLASHAHRSFKKGDRVFVGGRLRVRNWEKDEKRGTSVEIEAETIGHDLRWGVSRFEKRAGSHAQSSGPNEPRGEDLPASEPGHTSEASLSGAPQTEGSQAADVQTSWGEASSDGFVPKLTAA